MYATARSESRESMAMLPDQATGSQVSRLSDLVRCQAFQHLDRFSNAVRRCHGPHALLHVISLVDWPKHVKSGSGGCLERSADRMVTASPTVILYVSHTNRNSVNFRNSRTFTWTSLATCQGKFAIRIRIIQLSRVAYQRINAHDVWQIFRK